MTTTFGLPRWLFIYGLALPLAVLVGYILAVPLSLANIIFLGGLLFMLTFPVLMRWHHAMLIFTWNASLIVFFLPGQPNLGIIMAVVSLSFSVLARTMREGNRALYAPSVAWPLIWLVVVVVVTGKLTGGFGGRALGTEAWGAKRYLGVLGAVIGYFALVSQAAPRERARMYAYAFILSGTTAIISDMVYAAGPKFYGLYAVFTSNLAISQAFSQDTMLRLTGVAFGAMSGYHFMLMRYGISGLCEVAKPWRLIVFSALVAASLLGGYRSALLLALFLFAFQFYLEGLFRSQLLPVFLLVGALVVCGLVAFSERLPLSVQRSLSFLPLNVDPSAKLDARSSWDWRVDMWRVVVPEIPKYLLLGKGFAFSGTDMYLTEEATRRGLARGYDAYVVGGLYHQGVLTLIIPFGIFGVLGFAWFCWAGARVLYLNYRFGEKSLEQINRFLFAYFLSRLVFYLFLYGQFDMDLMTFTGAVGMSVCINGGVKAAKDIEPAAVATA